MIGILVSSRVYLSGAGGGVQWCTRDYLETMAAAGIDVRTVAYDTDRRAISRLRRKFVPRPFRDMVPPGVTADVARLAEETGARWVFLNNSEPVAVAAALDRALGPDRRLVYLSHGVESTDQVNALGIDAASVPAYRRRPAWIGRLLKAELEQRRHLDGVVCMSEEDTVFERWLGTRQACFVPRSIRAERLDWRPVRGRVGTVGTLNHLPNLDGIRRLAREMVGSAVRLRVVGGPAGVGAAVAREFDCVDYLGALDEAGLKAEAATWCAFVNPIFCQARGASTKVAAALGWGLPVVTTVQGARGYRWDDALLPRADSPKHLAATAIQIAGAGEHDAWQRRAGQLRSLAPSIAEAGEILREFLSNLER